LSLLPLLGNLFTACYLDNSSVVQKLPYNTRNYQTMVTNSLLKWQNHFYGVVIIGYFMGIVSMVV